MRVTGRILGIPEEMSDRFVEWVRSVLEFADDTERRNQAQLKSVTYFIEVMNERRGGDGTDLISELLRAEFDGQPIPDDVILGMIALVLIAGLDTTWSASGSMLLHLATASRRPPAASIAEPDLLPDRDRGDAAGVLTGDDGAHRRRGRRAPTAARCGGRPGPAQLRRPPTATPTCSPTPTR